MTTFHPTHTVPAHGRRVPVVIVDANDTMAGRPAYRVEAEYRAFTLQGMSGFWMSNRASYYPEFVRPLEAEADAELAFGLVLQDPDASAETVNAAMREWREVKGYVYEEVE